MRLPTGEIPNICLAHLAKQKVTKINFTSDQKGLSSGREKQFEEAEWIGDLRGTTHIGEMVGLFLSYFLVLTTKFYWRSFEFIAVFVWLHLYHTSQFASLRQRIHSAHLSVSLAWTVAAAAAGAGC